MPDEESSLDAAAELAGFFTAHAVWCVSDGATLPPILGFIRPDGTKEMYRFVDSELTTAIEQGQEWIATNPEGAARAALIVDGYVTLPSGKVDALIVVARQLLPLGGSFTIAIPYRPPTSPGGFAVHRPKFLGCEGVTPDYAAIGTAFFRGASAHDKGIEVWNECLDESV